VLEDALGGGQRINRINYEICVLQTLRERLRCKEIWVAGASRFRNPDDDRLGRTTSQTGMSRRLLKFLKRSLRIEIYAASGI